METDLLIYFLIVIPLSILLTILFSRNLKRQRKKFQRAVDMQLTRNSAYLQDQARNIVTMMAQEELPLEQVCEVTDKQLDSEAHQKLVDTLENVKNVKESMEANFLIKPGQPYHPKAITFSSN